jgi:hypothetical protein
MIFQAFRTILPSKAFLLKTTRMSKQVSFQINEQALADAELYAREHEKSLTDLLTEYVEALARIHREGGFLPIVENMIGVAREPGPESTDEARWAYLKNKHLGE